VVSAQFLRLVVSEDEENTTNLVSDLAWAYTIHAAQGLGPVAVKLCQWMATRRDIFPPNVCDRLAQLHDSGYAHSWKHTQQTLSDCFENFDEKGLEIGAVIGCGSAAQVYRGTLTTITSSGQVQKRSVAIKVLHPRFQELVDRDFVFIQALADLLHTLPFDHIRMINLPRVAENFGAVLRLQSDLSVEAANLHRFRANFYRDEKEAEEKSSIFFPRPIDGWTSSKAIVEEFVGDATPISQYLKDSSPSGLQVRKELAGPLLRAFLKMVFIDNFVHSDLHPGNVLVIESPMPERPSSNFWTLATMRKNTVPQETSSHEKSPAVKRSIVFLDAGICNSLSPEDQQNLSDLFRAVIFNDGNRAGRLMVERAKYERCSQTEGGVDRFAKGVEDIVSEFHDRRKDGLTLGAVRIGSLLTRVLDLCRDHGVEIDPSMANVVLSTLVLEGLGRSLEPNLNLIDFAKPFILGLGRV
jgi:aarF domain-containing kinase